MVHLDFIQCTRQNFQHPFSTGFLGHLAKNPIVSVSLHNCLDISAFVLLCCLSSSGCLLPVNPLFLFQLTFQPRLLTLFLLSLLFRAAMVSSFSSYSIKGVIISRSVNVFIGEELTGKFNLGYLRVRVFFTVCLKHKVRKEQSMQKLDGQEPRHDGCDMGLRQNVSYFYEAVLMWMKELGIAVAAGGF